MRQHRQKPMSAPQNDLNYEYAVMARHMLRTVFGEKAATGL